MITLLTALPPFPAPQPGSPFPGPSPNPTVPRGRRQQATCPTCTAPVAGLLAGCAKPPCLTADLDYDKALDRRVSQ